MIPTAATAPAKPDFETTKKRQQATWASGNYAIVGATLQIVGESLCEAVDLCAQERVLDVACGSGNAALAAARRFAQVTGIDYVPSLLDQARARAAAEGLALELHTEDLERLSFDDEIFDVVLSTYGCMFAPDQERAASEMLRVCRAGGRIGMANWTPEGFIGELFRLIGKHVPPPPGVRSPALWGSESRLAELFGAHATDISVARKTFMFRYASAEHWLKVFRTYYGPVHKAFLALDAERQAELERDILALIARFDRGGATLIVPGEYLEVVIYRA